MSSHYDFDLNDSKTIFLQNILAHGEQRHYHTKLATKG